jgi:hypothetical protein
VTTVNEAATALGEISVDYASVWITGRWRVCRD